MQQGLQQGLATERQLLLRQIRHRFGQEVAERSTSLLAQVTAPEVLEDLGELLKEHNSPQIFRTLLLQGAIRVAAPRGAIKKASISPSSNIL